MSFVGACLPAPPTLAVVGRPPWPARRCANADGCCHDEEVTPTTRREGDDPRVRFPEVAGRTLLDAEVTLPSGFPAERTLAVVAFQRWHQSRVDLWIARAVAAGVPATHRGHEQPVPVAVVEVPALATRWRPVRRFIDGGMTASIGDPDVLARTITVYTDVVAFRRALDIPSDEDVWAFVVTRDGTVLARGQGDPDDVAWDPVGAALLGD